MKRDEIVIGVEYARHGPLSFGKVPRRDPDRVRFVSKTPNVRMIHRYLVERREGRNYPSGKYLGSYVSREYDHLPESFFSAAADEPNGAVVEYRSPNVPGGLHAQTFSDGKWKDTIVAPAEVHMTWAEYEKDRIEYHVRRMKEDAPRRFDEALVSLMEQARLAGYSADHIRHRVETTLAARRMS